MNRLLLVAALLSCSGVCSPQAPNASDESADTITVRILNGKTGKPVKGEVLNIWLGDLEDQLLGADSLGELELRVSRDRHRTLRFLPAYYADCRFKKAQPTGMYIDLSLDEIISKGIVTENVCGKTQATPVAGILVVYVRRMTFLELWRASVRPSAIRVDIRQPAI